MDSVEISVSYQHEVAATPTRSAIMALQESMSELPGALNEQALEESLNTHFFAPGVYGRQMLIPAGMCVVGKIHKHAHINVITRGVIRVVTEFGEDTYSAPRTWVSEPGTKRAVYALEDTEWLTIHANPTDTKDIREIESQVIASSFDEFDALQLGQGDRE